MTAGLRSVGHAPAARWATRQPVGPSQVLATAADPLLRTEVIHFSTTAANEFWDLTPFLLGVVSRSQLSNGQATIFTPHTTTTIAVNEAETGFLNDFRRLIDGKVPAETYYEHDDHDVRTENLQDDEYVNGHAHCRAMLVGSASVTIPIVGGRPLLGTWQRVMFIELDQARPRRAVVHVQGT
jgi:secondary thiamine-phosphate synthase enzyme